MDALQSDLKIINQCYQHLSKTNQSDDLSYIDAYKYTFSRTGDHYLIQIIIVLDDFRFHLNRLTVNKITIIFNSLLKYLCLFRGLDWCNKLF